MRFVKWKILYLHNLFYRTRKFGLRGAHKLPLGFSKKSISFFGRSRHILAWPWLTRSPLNFRGRGRTFDDFANLFAFNHFLEVRPSQSCTWWCIKSIYYIQRWVLRFNDFPFVQKSLKILVAILKNFRVTAQFCLRPTVQTKFYTKISIRMITSLYTTKKVSLYHFRLSF